MKKITLSLLLWSLLISSASAEVTIAASIKPLALISTAIVGDRGNVLALVDAQQSPHDYSMKPSDRIAIERADILVWVSPTFEVYLADVFIEQSKAKPLVTFAELSSIKLAHETSGELDPHLWLDSNNAIILARAIAGKAGDLDSANAEYFRANFEIFRESVNAESLKIAAELASETRNSYAVYHNAYHYFEDQFGLSHAIVLLRNSELQPNIQEIIRVRNSVQKSKPACLMVDTDSNAAIISTMLNGYMVAQPVVDVIGNSIPMNNAGYISLLENIAAKFKECIY